VGKVTASTGLSEIVSKRGTGKWGRGGERVDRPLSWRGEGRCLSYSSLQKGEVLSHPYIENLLKKKKKGRLRHHGDAGFFFPPRGKRTGFLSC